MRDRPASRSLAALGSERPWLTIAVWVLFLAVLTPTALSYTQVVNYSAGSGAPAGTESARAAALLATDAPARSTLIVVVPQASEGANATENATLGFQAALAARPPAFFGGTSSVYTSYAGYLDGVFGSRAAEVPSLVAATENQSGSVYGFPATFLAAWSARGATAAALNASFAASNGSATGYDADFLAALKGEVVLDSGPLPEVEAAVRSAAPSVFPPGPELSAVLNDTNVSEYRNATPSLVAAELGSSGAPAVPVAWVLAAERPGDFGSQVVALEGLAGLPSFLRSQYMSPDGSIALVDVTFNVSDDYRTADGTYPAQAATPEVRSLAMRFFGTAAEVTGPGALAYDTQQVESGSGFLFAFTFVFLALAVAITLRSWIAPILALALVSAATVLGYLAVLVTGHLVGKVDFTVTYTLTAVTLGIATDYALFLLYRYREELTRGARPEAALATATRSSGFAVAVSAVTVAVGLGTLSLLSGLQTWGPVLFLTVLATAALVLTLLPAILRLIGPRLFVARWMRPASPPEGSVFYRAAARSSRRPTLVVALAAVVLVPAFLGFVLVPTSYDFTGGIPSATPSAQGLHTIQSGFGANLLYPTEVIVTPPAPLALPNGSLTPEARALLPLVAADLLHHRGVRAVEGPFVSGSNVSTNATAAGSASAFLLDGGRSAYFLVYSSYGPYSAGAISLVASLRSNGSYLVGGVTSTVIDEQAVDGVQYPVLEILLTVFIAIILGLAFRSFAVPVISVAGVFLSISATTGLLYLIGTYLLHAPLLWVIPLILFVILMSLGNDYTVFLLARIREEQAAHGPEEGIRRGIAGSGVVVSALGLILAASLGSLALQPISFLQELGIGFGISLVLDTFVMRPFFFPAALTLVERRHARGGSGGGAEATTGGTP